MNVVMVMHYFWPRAGGEERVGRFLGRELVARGHTVTFVVAAYDPALPATDSIDGITIYRISEQHRRNLGFLHRWLWFRRNRWLLDQADVVHCHDPIMFTRWVFVERLLRPRLAMHMTIHGYEGWPIPRSAKVERFVACRFMRTVMTVPDLRCFYPGTRADRVIYGGASLVPDAGRPPDAPERYIAFIGRLAPGHNPVGVVHAVARWQELGGAPPPVMMFGEGPLETATRDAISATGADVRLCGRTDEPQRWMRHAEAIFCGGYTSLIEALLAGVPAYCMDNDPVIAECWRQIPTDGFVHARDPEALAEQLRADELVPAAARDRTARGHAWAGTQTWAHMADDYEDAWSGKLGRR